MAKKLNIDSLEPKIVMEPVSKDEIHYIRCNVLIVCEGEKTEPNYFRSFDMMKNSSGFVYDITTDGGGINTIQVVDKAIDLKNKAANAGKPFDSVWAVFDRDSFKASDFDNAITKAEANGIECAWSNEAFEIWYVYHFDYRCTAMSRTEYKKAITQRVRSAGYHFGKKNYIYRKNDPQMRHILSVCHCDEKIAIKNAERQVITFCDHKYHKHNPCTMVYRLVRLLRGEDQRFNKQIKQKLKLNN